MTMFDDEFNRIFKKMSNSFFNIDDIFEEFKTKGSSQGPYYYGYTMTVGPDGKPIVKEYGNAKPGLVSASNTREPIVDSIVDEKEKLVKLVAEMPGVEKSDVKILVEGKSVNISAERKNIMLMFQYNTRLMKILQKPHTRMEFLN
jgi:HSP20 family protein